MNPVFHIGLHKTASTWLQQVFFPHHGQLHNLVDSAAPWADPLLYALVKTPDKHFDATLWRQQLQNRIASVPNLNGHALLVSAERLSGHPANGGADRFRTARRIRSVAPRAKVLCVLRNQASMIPSLYRTMLNEGYAGTVEDLFHDHTWKTAGPHPVFFEYDLLVREYQNLFSRSNCLFLCYEHMLADPEDFLKRICRFIGVAEHLPGKQAIHRKVNTGFPSRGLGLFRRLNAYRKTEYNPHVAVALPETVFRGFVIGFRRLKPAGSILNRNQQASIQARYAHSNERLARLLDEDMAAYAASYARPRQN